MKRNNKSMKVYISKLTTFLSKNAEIFKLEMDREVIN